MYLLLVEDDWGLCSLLCCRSNFAHQTMNVVKIQHFYRPWERNGLPNEDTLNLAAWYVKVLLTNLLASLYQQSRSYFVEPAEELKQKQLRNTSPYSCMDSMSRDALFLADHATIHGRRSNSIWTGLVRLMRRELAIEHAS